MQDHLSPCCWEKCASPWPRFSPSSPMGSSRPHGSIACLPVRGAVCVGLSRRDPCRRRPGAEGLCEPSCLAPSPRSDVGAAGRNSEFLRGHSSHSCAGPPWPPPHRGPPPATRARLQRLLLKPISMAPFQTHISFHTPGWKQTPPPCPEAFIQRLLAAPVLFQRAQSIAAASVGQEGALRLP